MKCEYCELEFEDGELIVPLREYAGNHRVASVSTYVHMPCFIWKAQGKP